MLVRCRYIPDTTTKISRKTSGTAQPPTTLKAFPQQGAYFYSQSAVDHTIPGIWP